jgi:hypothetical protein
MNHSIQTARTQRERILQLLCDARGEWVPLPNILELKISQFGARILELRRSGLRITNRTKNIDGQKHSWYRIESCDRVNASASVNAVAAQAPLTAPTSLFGDLSSQGRYPD